LDKFKKIIVYGLLHDPGTDTYSTARLLDFVDIYLKCYTAEPAVRNMKKIELAPLIKIFIGKCINSASIMTLLLIN
jgi:hypothetical protein